jgi:para-nitrobenzyl esterase
MTLDPTISRIDPSRRRALKTAAAAAFVASPLSGLLQGARAQSDGPVVNTTAGPVRGAMNGAAYVFKGVPYGAPTSGDGRFMPPRPPVPWTQPRSALAYGNRAPGLGYPPFLMKEEGVDLDTSPAGEDSLVLNVWTAGLQSSAKRPVMVWFHGGGYNSGSGGSVRYDGTRLATRRDVVVVTVNHRIGALGFLYLGEIGGPEYAKSGNVGMLDIVQSLEWVRDNIAAFGGDASNVTVFGESGGGGKVSTLTAMPAARGLFHRVIAESGSAVTVATPAAATRSARAVLEKLGVDPSNLDALKTMPFERISAATPGNIGPVMDGVSLPRQPFDPDASPVSASVPMLIGSNLTEINFFNDTPLDPIDDAALQAKVAAYTKLDAAKSTRLIDAYRRDHAEAANHQLYQLIATDWWMTSNVHLQAERKAAQGAAPVYVYQFAQKQGARDGKLNVPHTSEIAYVFDNLALSTALVGEATAEQQAVADMISQAWVAFARSGNPNVPGAPAWQPYTLANRTVMVLDAKPHLAPASLVEAQALINSMKSA